MLCLVDSIREFHPYLAPKSQDYSKILHSVQKIEITLTESLLLHLHTKLQPHRAGDDIHGGREHVLEARAWYQGREGVRAIRHLVDGGADDPG